VQGGAKLIDFGGAAAALFDECGRAAPDAANTRAPPLGKRSYVAPEAARGRRPLRGGALDVWGVGVIAFALQTGSSYVLTGDPIWVHLTTGRAPAVIAAWNMPDALSAAGAAFVHRCLQVDPTARPSAAEALDDPWLAAAPTGTEAGGGTAAEAAPASAVDGGA
jgi:serine/threonine protein kinase